MTIKFCRLFYRKSAAMKYSYTINQQLYELVKDENHLVANLSNASALLFDYLEDVNWVGFYLWSSRENQLILGPFQGRVACNRIKLNEGVCGQAFYKEETIRVANVHKFKGHIACDANSNAEIVIPIISEGNPIGVLDIDSPKTDRFSQEDQLLLEETVQVLSLLFSSKVRENS